MRWEQVQDRVRAEMRPQRWDHVLGVVALAERLVERFRVADLEAVRLAAGIHDVARDWDAARLLRAVDGSGIMVDDVERRSVELLHGPAGAAWAGQVLGVERADVVDAVRYHTTGRVGATEMEMVLMVADYGEPGRRFAEAAKVRNLALTGSLRKAFLASLDARLAYLLAEGWPIHPRTVDARNWVLRQGGL